MNGLSSILIVDGEQPVRESLEQWFAGEGHKVTVAASARQALEALAAGSFDLALIDIKMPAIDGIELLSRLKQAEAEMPVIITTGYASVATAVQALKQGAYDYLTKPVDPDVLSHAVTRAIEHHRARRDVARLLQTLEEKDPAPDLIGASPPVRRVREFIQMVAPTDSTVLITGESGAGKEVVARAIHNAGPRRHMPMVVIHCGALTETLLESELFGHEPGAFTGAQYRKKGKFEAAAGGTLFLDEVSDISLRTQTDLLRVLQQKEIVRVGGTHPIKIDFRCIAATNRSLEGRVKAGAFRPDLFHHLNLLRVELAPLAARREDIPLLTHHFLARLCATTNRTSVPHITPAAMELLTSCAWPGNVRELENAIERALVVSRANTLDESSFSFLKPTPNLNGITLGEVERAHVLKIWEQCARNHSRAARVLGIDRTTLYAKLHKYGLK